MAIRSQQRQNVVDNLDFSECQLLVIQGDAVMSDYLVTLLGIPGVQKDGELVHFPYRKAEGIFYYLCIEKETNRDELISVFWGSGDEASGRKNLRQALFQIRRCLGEDVIVLQGRNDLKLNQRVGIRTEWDLRDEDFILHRERLLDYFYLKDCPEFESWLENKRALQISRSLDYIRERLKNPSVCRDVALLHCLVDTWAYWKPWDEEMVLTGMKCYAQAEKYDLGVQLYHEYVKQLQTDLEETPSHRVEVLVRTLLHRKEVSLTRCVNSKEYFFGRLSEIQFIDEQIFLFLNGESTKSVIIKGEVGVGKTALMQQIAEMNRGAGVLQLISHCYEAESGIPLRSWRDNFMQLEQLIGDGKISLSQAGARAISLVLNGTAVGSHDTFRIKDGEYLNYTAIENEVLALLKELCAQWKIILYFDSLHWMDVISRRLLQRIMIEFGNDRVFLIATCRINGEQDIRGLLVALSERGLTTSLLLPCFSEEETRNIVADTLKGRLDTDVNAHEIYLRTEGHPLVLTGMLNMILQEGWDGTSLPRLDMLIQLQLEKLTPRQRKVLDALSVHIEHADLDDLKLLTGMEPMELVEILEELLSTHFVTEQTLGNNIIYKFRHQFYKDHVYQHLSMGKRRLWHRTIAESYEKKRNEARWRVLLPYTIRHYENSGDVERAARLREIQNNM